MRKTSPVLPRSLASNRVNRHVGKQSTHTSMGACDEGRSIDSRRTLACQYGSRDEFAIMLARTRIR